MSKVKILSIISAVMLLLNIILLWQLFSHRPEGRGGPHREGRRGRPREAVIEQLKFDANQTKQYEALIETHKAGMDEQREIIQSLKKELYPSLKTTHPAIKSDSLINEIAKTNVQIEQLHLQHFKDIKAICKPEQLPLYDEFCSRISEIFEQRRGGPRGN